MFSKVRNFIGWVYWRYEDDLIPFAIFAFIIIMLIAAYGSHGSEFTPV